MSLAQRFNDLVDRNKEIQDPEINQKINSFILEIWDPLVSQKVDIRCILELEIFYVVTKQGALLESSGL